MHPNQFCDFDIKFFDNVKVKKLAEVNIQPLDEARLKQSLINSNCRYALGNLDISLQEKLNALLHVAKKNNPEIKGLIVESFNYNNLEDLINNKKNIMEKVIWPKFKN